MRSVTMIVCALCASVSLVQAGKAPPTTAEAEESETRVYDIRDFIYEVRDYPFEGVMGLPKEPAGLLEGPEKKPTTQARFSRHAQAEAVLSLIQETVDPDSWRANGGTEGSMRELVGQLIITQTPENHRMIQHLFSQLRENAGMVHVKADWVMLTAEQLGAVRKKIPTKDRKHVESRAVDMDALAGANVPRLHAEITCFHGQTVSVSSGRTRTVIYDQEAVVAQNAVAMSPQVRQVSDGAMLEINPTPMADLDFALVEVHSKVAQWGEASPVTQGFSHSTTRPGDRAITGVADSAVIDRLNVLTQEFKCSTRIPLNQPVLIGGMTMEPADGKAPQMYLILTVSLTGGVG